MDVFRRSSVSATSRELFPLTATPATASGILFDSRESCIMLPWRWTLARGGTMRPCFLIPWTKSTCPSILTASLCPGPLFPNLVKLTSLTGICPTVSEFLPVAGCTSCFYWHVRMLLPVIVSVDWHLFWELVTDVINC